MNFRGCRRNSSSSIIIIMHAIKGLIKHKHILTAQKDESARWRGEWWRMKKKKRKVCRRIIFKALFVETNPNDNVVRFTTDHGSCPRTLHSLNPCIEEGSTELSSVSPALECC